MRSDAWGTAGLSAAGRAGKAGVDGTTESKWTSPAASDARAVRRLRGAGLPPRSAREGGGSGGASTANAKRAETAGATLDATLVVGEAVPDDARD